MREAKGINRQIVSLGFFVIPTAAPNKATVYKRDHFSKAKITGSIFTEKFTFDGENYRTARVNEAFCVIFALGKAFEENKNGTNNEFPCLSHQVIPLGVPSYVGINFSSQ
jgi:hypothetical protein